MKPSKKDLEEELVNSKLQADIWERVATHLLRGAKPPKVRSRVVYGVQHIYSLFEPRGAHGGILVEEFRCRGQQPSFRAGTSSFWERERAWLLNEANSLDHRQVLGEALNSLRKLREEGP